MKAYWVVRASISDSEEYGIYRELAGPIVASFNGVFLSRGGSQEEVEGSGYQRHCPFNELTCINFVTSKSFS